MKVKNGKNKEELYKLFLNWAMNENADGVIVGATFPEIVKYCKKKTRGKLKIYSPGIGIQGGKISAALASGTDYMIVGRTILKAKNPVSEAKKLQSSSL